MPTLSVTIYMCHTWTIHMALEPTASCSIPWERLEEVVVPLEETRLSLDDSTGPAWLEKVGHTGVVLAIFKTFAPVDFSCKCEWFEYFCNQISVSKSSTGKWGTLTTCEKFGLSDVTTITQELWHRRGDVTAHLVRIKDIILSLPAVTCLVVRILPAFARKFMEALWKAVSLTCRSSLVQPHPNNSAWYRCPVASVWKWQLSYKAEKFCSSYKLKIISS